MIDSLRIRPINPDVTWAAGGSLDNVHKLRLPAALG